MNCSACLSKIDIEQDDYLRCTVLGCGKCYHLLCTGERNPTKAAKKSWSCLECLSVSKRGGDNTLTPVGAIKKHRDCNVTVRQKVVHTQPKDDESLIVSQDITHEVRELRSDLKSMREQLTYSNTLISNYQNKLREAVSTIAEYDSKLSQSVVVIAGYESKMEMYAMQMDQLLDKLKKSEDCVSVLQNPTQKDSSSYSETLLKKKERSMHNTTTSTQLSRTVDSAEPKLHTASSFEQPPPETGSILTPQPDGEIWTDVQYRKPRKSLSLRCVAGPTVTSLKAAECRKHFHLWNMLSGEDDVKKYLSELLPQRVVTVEQLKTSNYYNSFKIGVPEDCYDQCFSINVWPENARVKPWINYKKRRPVTTDDRTFRRGVGAQ